MEVRRILRTDIKTLALKYGGYTSLDKVYLDQLLAGKNRAGAVGIGHPPPSVVNAYFAELYQKKESLKQRRIILQKSVRNWIFANTGAKFRPRK